MSSLEKRGLLLPGLDGTNPLGFLAALGLQRTLHEAGKEPRLQWQAANATWVPVLVSCEEAEESAESVLDVLDAWLAKTFEAHPILAAIKTNSAEDRRCQFKVTVEQASTASRRRDEWLASLGSDAADEQEGSQLQTVRRDYFEGNLKSLITNTKKEHLDRSLFHVWDLADQLDNHSLHLNPSEDRRHAYQWNKPSGDPERKYSGGMIGANRLAIEAWPLFPTIPVGKLLQTVGFTGVRAANTRWTWPLWHIPAKLNTVRALLSFHDLQSDALSTSAAIALRQVGVCAVYRSRRILVGKTPNFTPAQRIA